MSILHHRKQDGSYHCNLRKIDAQNSQVKLTEEDKISSRGSFEHLYLDFYARFFRLYLLKQCNFWRQDLLMVFFQMVYSKTSFNHSEMHRTRNNGIKGIEFAEVRKINVRNILFKAFSLLCVQRLCQQLIYVQMQFITENRTFYFVPFRN